MDANRNASLVLASRYNGRESPSNRVRSPILAARLKEQAAAIQVLSLQGDLSLDGMERVVRELLEDASLKHAVLDLHRVSSIGVPAANLLHQARRELESRGCDLVLSRLKEPSELAATLDATCGDQAPLTVFPDNDRAMEWCEDRLLAQLQLDEPATEAKGLDDFAFFAGITQAEANALTGILRPESYAEGAEIVSSGDSDDDRLFLICSGEVSVLLPLRDAGSQRLATLGAGMVFGEMALFDQSRRSATVRADSAVTCWVMSAKDLDVLARDFPGLKITLLQNLSRSLATRLNQANGLVAALAG
jgi:glutaminase